MIPERTLRTLEFDKILAQLADHASFSAGRDAALTLRPVTDLKEASRLQQQTAEAQSLLEGRPSIHLGGAHDVRPAARRAEVGAILAPSELLEIAGTLGASARIRSSVASVDIHLPWLQRQTERMVDDRDLVHAIESTFNDHGEVLDSASPELRRIRNEMRTAQGRITERLNSMVTSQEYRTALQEPIVTMRNGRYVIPVRQDSKGKVQGIVHDQSSSGQTIFVEPLAVTEMNNRLKELELAELREIERILQELSERVASKGPAIRETVEALAAVDLAFARARYGSALRAVPPALNSEGQTRLMNARHPLLKGNVVPISIWIGEEFRVLVITGPNTGGKTVALKTLGLLTLMAQAGMHVPADAGSRVGLCASVFADIGDEQSIEQSLSTFSSHMRNIIGMLSEIDAGSLVLLDELGAGTDPAEGTALARAIITTLLQSGARALVTTHYNELKTFAHEEEGLENASVEFDVETLSPTYKLIIGLPGRSQALAIANRLGMPQKILAMARQHVSAGAVRVEKLLAQIGDERRAIGELYARAGEMHEDTRKLRDRVRSELASIQKERERILSEAREEAAAAVREMRGRLRELESDAKRLGSRREQGELRSRLEEITEETAESIGTAPAAERETLRPVVAGATVNILSLGQQGTVLTVSGGEAEVQLGQFKTRIPTDDLEVLSRKERAPERAVEIQTTHEAPPIEIDVRGWRADDAVREIDQYLHDNYMHGQGTIRIVHGKGTGALRRAIRDQLGGHPLVKGFESEKPQQGGEGVTVVKLSV